MLPVPHICTFLQCGELLEVALPCDSFSSLEKERSLLCNLAFASRLRSRIRLRSKPAGNFMTFTAATVTIERSSQPQQCWMLFKNARLYTTPARSRKTNTGSTWRREFQFRPDGHSEWTCSNASVGRSQLEVPRRSNRFGKAKKAAEQFF